MRAVWLAVGLSAFGDDDEEEDEDQAAPLPPTPPFARERASGSGKRSAPTVLLSCEAEDGRETPDDEEDDDDEEKDGVDEANKRLKLSAVDGREKLASFARLRFVAVVAAAP